MRPVRLASIPGLSAAGAARATASEPPRGRVFARSSDARQFLAWDEKGVRQGTIRQGKNVVLVARNAVYFGENVPAAHRAMATLRG